MRIQRTIQLLPNTPRSACCVEVVEVVFLLQQVQLGLDVLQPIHIPHGIVHHIVNMAQCGGDVRDVECADGAGGGKGVIGVK